MSQSVRYLPHDFIREFLELYRALPCLWKIRSPDYSNRVKRGAAYEQLLELCKKIDTDASIDFVKAKIATFRGSFRKELKKIWESKKSSAGEEEVYVPKLWYFDLLLFTADQETPRESTSNLQDQQNQDSQEKPADPKGDEEISSDTAGESTPEPSRPSSACLEISGTAENSGAAASSFKTHVYVSRNKKKRHLEFPKQRLLEKAEKYLDAEDDDELDFFGKFVATRLRQLNDQQRVLAEKQIMEILYNCSQNMVSSQFSLANKNQMNTRETLHSTNLPASGQEEDFSSYISL
ncbi:uncharacterized protein [Palaemon carinicauda]|uniref:uncharacterized protein n=1 Tax=Palaemon carinicauda TaxID=392227 RepID=UPI0035B657F0